MFLLFLLPLLLIKHVPCTSRSINNFPWTFPQILPIASPSSHLHTSTLSDCRPITCRINVYCNSTVPLLASILISKEEIVKDFGSNFHNWKWLAQCPPLIFLHPDGFSFLSCVIIHFTLFWCRLKCTLPNYHDSVIQHKKFRYNTIKYSSVQ